MNFHRFSLVNLAYWLSTLLALAGAVNRESSSEYLVQVWNTDAGLPHSTVTSIAQTPDGYLWVGTRHGGLARFDGKTFVTFHPGNTPELKSIEIQKLIVDSQGTLWINLVEGLLISYRDGQFRFERRNSQTPQNWLDACLKSNEKEVVFSLATGLVIKGIFGNKITRWEILEHPDDIIGNPPYLDGSGTLWYRANNAFIGQLHGTKFSPITNGLIQPLVNCAAVGSDGRLRVATEKELAVWNGTNFINETPTNAPPTITVRQLCPCQDGSIWLRTSHEILKVSGRRLLASTELWDSSKSAQIRNISMWGDSKGEIWGTHLGGGLWHVDNEGKKVTITEQDGLPSGSIVCWFEDKEGNVWVGITGGGLACIHSRTFHTLGPVDNTHYTPKTVCEDLKGDIWIGTTDNQVLHWANGRFQEFSIPADPETGTDTTIIPASGNRMWVGGVRSGLLTFESNKFTRPFPSEKIGIVGRILYLDHAGKLWIGNEFGLFCWSNGKLKVFSKEDNFSPAYVLAITEDNKGRIWLGTAIGELRKYEEGRFDTFRPADSLTDPETFRAATTADPMRNVGRGALSSGGERFWSLHADADGVIWIGTLGGGLLRFKDGHFTRFSLQQGVPSEHISQILEDEHGCLWLGMRNGIAQINKADLNDYALNTKSNLSFITYGKMDGLPILECTGGSQPTCWKGKDGRLWFTTTKAVVWVDPNHLPRNPVTPKVFVEEIRVDGKETFSNAFAATNSFKTLPDNLKLTPGRHYIEFKFTATSFTSPDKVNFKWRLNGLENDWVNGGAKRSVSYSLLPPGNYQFHVCACNNDGIWNNASAIVNLTVMPFFWQRWWFKLAVIILVLFILWTVYSVRVGRLKALERLRLRIARDLHDEVGANLASISLLSQLMETTPSSSDASQVHGIAVQTIDTLRDIIWFIDPQHDHLTDLTARLKETARMMLGNVKYRFEQSGEFDSVNLTLTFRRNVPPIFKEALHNLLKHSNATEVEIFVIRENHEFRLSVKDNGTGFDGKQKGTGNGLKNMHRRAEELGGILNILTSPAHGTKITLTVPLTQTRDWWKGKSGLS